MTQLSVPMVAARSVRYMAQRSLQSGWGTPQPQKSPRAQLEDLGFKPLRRPATESPELPSALSDLPDSELVGLMAQFNNWASYAGDLVAESTITRRKAERNRQRVHDSFMILHKSEKTVAAAKARVQQEPDYIDAEDAVSNLDDLLSLLSSQHSHFVDSGKVLSRELTRRLDRAKLETRYEKYST